MTDEQDAREVIEVDFKPRPPADADTDVGLRIKGRWESKCRHQRQTIYEDTRRVECRDCGAPLDPVECMLGWARDWQRYAGSVKGLRQEIERRNRELDEVKRQLANAKASLRRATR